jgi:hydrogenase expression/formation protein HypE
MDSVKEAADEAGVKIVGGDTKVVPRGVCDKIFINTSGIGFVDEGVNISSQNAEVGDAIIVSGGISEHGIAILSDREGLGFGIESDCAPLNWLVQDMLRQSRNIHCLRDLTRGGLATCLCEIAESSGVGMRIAEDMIPIKEEVKGACEILGFDPLYIASEGRLLAILPRDDAERVLAAMRRNRLGSSAQIVGEVIDDSKLVRLCTRIGGERILDILQGEQLPRIC